MNSSQAAGVIDVVRRQCLEPHQKVIAQGQDDAEWFFDAMGGAGDRLREALALRRIAALREQLLELIDDEDEGMTLPDDGPTGRLYDGPSPVG